MTNRKSGNFMGKKSVSDALNEMLDFGPEIDLTAAAPVPNHLNARLEALVKKLKEMNERMDRLASQL